MENEMKLIVPEMETISRSAERTINPSNYIPGKGYESKKLSAFRSRQVSASLTPEAKSAISEELFSIVESEVEKAAEAYIAGLRNSSDVPAQLNASEMAPIADILAEANEATSKTKLTAVKAKATERKSNLTKSQLEYLASVFRKIENKL